MVDYEIVVVYGDFENYVKLSEKTMALRGQVRNPEALGRMLQQGRALRGLSQRDLANELGISQKWIWEMENGKPGLLTDRLFKMLRATGCRLYIEIDVPENETSDG